jgi:hypothetical protein
MENIRPTQKRIGLNTLISWGASIVIVGLTFKLLHWEGGEWMIAIGLLTESCLFFLLGYASLNDQNRGSLTLTADTAAPSKNMEDLLATSIDKQTIERLKNGFEQFNKTVESVNYITDTTKTTQDMVREIENTTREVQQLRKNLEELNTVYRAQLDAFRKS